MTEPLTRIEMEATKLAAQGLSDKEIGHELGVSAQTAKHHLQSIRSKLGINNRVEIALVAVSLGLVKGLSFPSRIPQLKWVRGRLKAIRIEIEELERQIEICEGQEDG